VQGLLFVVPVLLLALALVVKGYPGERAIEWLRAARIARRSRPSSLPWRPRVRPHALLRGGRLISGSLAGRAPPSLAGCR